MPPIEDADQMDSLELEVVDQSKRVRGHVVERVDGGTGQPDHPRRNVDAAPELGRQPDVTIVEADDVEAPLGEHPAELRVPGEHLHAEAHDEEDRLRLRIAEVVVAELDPVDPGELRALLRDLDGLGDHLRKLPAALARTADCGSGRRSEAPGSSA